MSEDRIYLGMQDLLNDTLGRRLLETDDVTKLKIAAQDATIGRINLEKRILKTRVSNLESALARERNTRIQLEHEIAIVAADLLRARTDANYFRLVLQTFTHTEDTAREILNLREWVRIAYNSLQKAGPLYTKEFEINCPWVKREPAEPQPVVVSETGKEA